MTEERSNTAEERDQSKTTSTADGGSTIIGGGVNLKGEGDLSENELKQFARMMSSFRQHINLSQCPETPQLGEIKTQLRHIKYSVFACMLLLIGGLSLFLSQMQVIAIQKNEMATLQSFVRGEISELNSRLSDKADTTRSELKQVVRETIEASM